MYIILVYNCVFDYITDCKFNKTCKYSGLVLNFRFLESLYKYLEFGILYPRAANPQAFWGRETNGSITSKTQIAPSTNEFKNSSNFVSLLVTFVS